jgi:hypothetical protein
VLLRLLLRRTFALHRLDDPDWALRLFTFVAACGVLAARFEPHRLPVWVLGGAAVLTWLVLSPIAVRSMATRGVGRLRDGARGAWLLASVATSGVAICLADASREAGQRLLWAMALVVWVLAVLGYTVITWLIALGMSADRSMTDRAEPDSWILMGGLAIATLAGNHIYRALGASSPLREGVKIATVTIWVLASIWIPALVYLSLRRVNARAGSLRFAGVLVGAGVSPRHVLDGDRGDVDRRTTARAVDDLAGVLLDSRRRLARRRGGGGAGGIQG